jgi:hypothetical protein
VFNLTPGALSPPAANVQVDVAHSLPPPGRYLFWIIAGPDDQLVPLYVSVNA